MSPVDHHVQQQRVNTCVVACTQIVLSWLGQPQDEASIAASWEASKRGYDIGAAASALGGKHWRLDPDEPRHYDLLQGWLNRPLWIIAQMFSGPMGRFADGLSPPPTPAFSSLRSAGVGALHAIVLVAADATSIHILDPYFPQHNQPFMMPRDVFAEAWQGEVVVPRAPAREG